MIDINNKMSQRLVTLRHPFVHFPRQLAHIRVMTGRLTPHKVTKYSLLMHYITTKGPAKSLLNEQYVFVGGNISFLCVLSCSSEEA